MNQIHSGNRTVVYCHNHINVVVLPYLFKHSEYLENNLVLPQIISIFHKNLDIPLLFLSIQSIADKNPYFVEPKIQSDPEWFPLMNSNSRGLFLDFITLHPSMFNPHNLLLPEIGRENTGGRDNDSNSDLHICY